MHFLDIKRVLTSLVTAGQPSGLDRKISAVKLVFKHTLSRKYDRLLSFLSWAQTPVSCY